ERQMAKRCPRSIFVAPARVSGYRLAFRGYSVTRRGAVATIVPDAARRVHGALYVLAAGDLERLDRFEGCPRFYHRIEVKVRLDLPGIDAGRHRAVTYSLRSSLTS